MVDKENMGNISVLPESVEMDREAQRMVSEFLMPEFDSLKRLFDSRDDFQITVFIRSGSFTTSHTTFAFPVLVCPTDNSPEFWSKVMKIAEAAGMETDCFPKKIPPYFFSFKMHYGKK